MTQQQTTGLAELFDRYIGIALSRQCAFADSVPTPYWDWKYEDDGERGHVTIPDLGTFEVQFLGSESYVSNTWLAAWANQSVSNGFANASTWLRDHAAQLGDARLGEEYLPLDRINGDYIGVIGTIVLQASAYFALPVGNGAGQSFQVIFDIPLINFAPTPLNRINTVLKMIEESTQVSDVSWAMHYYLEDEGFKCEEIDVEGGFNKIFTDDGGRKVTFEYKESEQDGEKTYHVTRSLDLTEDDSPIRPEHFDVTAQWDAFIRAPLSRPIADL